VTFNDSIVTGLKKETAFETSQERHLHRALRALNFQILMSIFQYWDFILLIIILFFICNSLERISFYVNLNYDEVVDISTGKLVGRSLNQFQYKPKRFNKIGPATGVFSG